MAENQPEPASPSIDLRLQYQLQTVAARIRARGLHRRSALAWLILSVLGVGWVALCWRYEPLKGFSFPVLALASLVVGWIIGGWWRRAPYDYHAAAALIEKDHPDLQQALRTALEQQPGPGGAYHFLQRRVIDRALQHAGKHRWSDSRRHVKPWLALAHTASLGLLIVALAFSIQPPKSVLAVITPAGPFAGEISVTPGNSEVERGSSVVIAARFGGHLPRSATLVWTPAGGTPQHTAMARSLSDPVYAITLPRVENDVDYQVIYQEASSEAFRLQVFDRPALVQADATVDYPEFTGLTDRKIEDTRRLSAVEGTKVDYEFMFNKPVKKATLRTADGEEVPLVAVNPERTRYAHNFTVSESVRYTLHLEDDAARENHAPPDIRIEALVNRRPDLKVTFPRGDQRVSALEELKLQAEARDDFGLLDFGMAIAVGAEPAKYVSLRSGDAKTALAQFEQLLTLESEGVKPDDLVTWFAWADDAVADGAARRTESDPFFGEVRPFDEIFREQREGGGAGAGQSGGEQAELLELQRQIVIGTRKLRQQEPKEATFADDVDLLAEAQSQAQTMLSAEMEEVRDPNLLSAANDASRFMDQARSALKEASSAGSTDPLTRAGSAAQGAYQSLLRMQPRETNVSQSRNGGGGGGGRNQRQLNQLRFRDNEDNYENQSQAEAMTSPEEREKLETLSRLKELARRQQDVNERLQQLQTALQEAKSDEERDRIQRELKRLEEEQRRMLSDLDEVRQRLDQQPPSNSARDAREQLEQTRESMRQAGESLQQGDVSQALAQGTRAQDNLEQVSDDLRKESSSRFAEQLRQARQTARELADGQQQTEQKLNNFDTEGPRSLDSSAERGEIADQIEARRAEHQALVEQLRQITEDSEVSEPGLHRQLYDLLRQHGQKNTENEMENSSELLRRGFVDQARELQPGVTRDLDELRRGVERAAESVLGDETSTLRFAQNELDELSRQLENERGAGDESGDQPGAEGAEREGQEGARAPGGAEGREQADAGQRGRGQAGRGEETERGDEPGTGESGLAQSERPGQQPGTGARGTEASRDEPGTGGERREPGEQPGASDEPGVGQPQDRAGERTGFARGESEDAPGVGERSENRAGEARAPGEQPGNERGAAQAGQSQPRPGQAPGENEGQGQGEGEGQREGTQLAQGQSPQGQNQPGMQPGQSAGERGQSGEGSTGGGQGQRQGETQGQREGQDRGATPSMAGNDGARGGSPNQGGTGQRQPGGNRGGGGGGGGGETDAGDDITRALEELYGGTEGGGGRGEFAGGPITGENYAEWEERLRTVEALLDSPEARARLAEARERAQEMRTDFRRHSKLPQWGTIESGIAAPLSEVRTWLRQELARREDPASLQPVDRDPVPERFEENVRKYYEALGE